MSANISLLMLRNLIGLAVWGAVFALSAHAAKKTPAQPAQATPAPEAETEAADRTTCENPRQSYRHLFDAQEPRG